MLCDLPLAELLRLLEAGDARHRALLESCLDRIATRDGELRAFTRLASGEQLTADRPAVGPLAGVPVGVKDIIDTADLPTERGCERYANRQPDVDAHCVATLRRAGAIVIGKTTTTELACSPWCDARNPHDPTRTPGGSSAGSAAAVAAGMVPAALGTQTAASTIRPASYCGVVGFVPSRGILPMDGVLTLAPTSDALGVLARTVADSRIIFDCLRGAIATRGSPDRLRGRVGVVDQLRDVDDVMREAVDRAASITRAMGLEVQLVHAPTEELRDIYETFVSFEIARSLTAERRTKRGITPWTAAYLDQCAEVSRVDYDAAVIRRNSLLASVTGLLAGLDALLTPAAPGAAPPWTEGTGAYHMSSPWQLLGLPAVTVPGYTDPQGLPLGVQLVGERHREDALLSLAGDLEAAFREDNTCR